MAFPDRGGTGVLAAHAGRVGRAGGDRMNVYADRDAPYHAGVPCRESAGKAGTSLASLVQSREGVMTHVPALRSIGGFFVGLRTAMAAQTRKGPPVN